MDGSFRALWLSIEVSGEVQWGWGGGALGPRYYMQVRPACCLGILDAWRGRGRVWLGFGALVLWRVGLIVWVGGGVFLFTSQRRWGDDD